MTLRAALKGFARKIRNYSRKIEESRADLADSASSENALPPIPPDKPRRNEPPRRL
jgi:hypothetical protein